MPASFHAQSYRRDATAILLGDLRGQGTGAAIQAAETAGGEGVTTLVEMVEQRQGTVMVMMTTEQKLKLARDEVRYLRGLAQATEVRLDAATALVAALEELEQVEATEDHNG